MVRREYHTDSCTPRIPAKLVDVDYVPAGRSNVSADRFSQARSTIRAGMGTLVHFYLGVSFEV